MAFSGFVGTLRFFAGREQERNRNRYLEGMFGSHTTLVLVDSVTA